LGLQVCEAPGNPISEVEKLFLSRHHNIEDGIAMSIPEEKTDEKKETEEVKKQNKSSYAGRILVYTVFLLFIAVITIMAKRMSIEEQRFVSAKDKYIDFIKTDVAESIKGIDDRISKACISAEWAESKPRIYHRQKYELKLNVEIEMPKERSINTQDIEAVFYLVRDKLLGLEDEYINEHCHISMYRKDGYWYYRDRLSGEDSKIPFLKEDMMLTIKTTGHCFETDGKRITDTVTGMYWERFDSYHREYGVYPPEGYKWVSGQTISEVYIAEINRQSRAKEEAEKKRQEELRKNKSSISYDSNKAYKSVERYDAGFDDVYLDGEYDEERYRRDQDYADGVDDAMGELDEWW